MVLLYDVILRMTVFRKLDFGEDMARRRLKVLPNPGGSSHLEACRKQSRDEMGEKEEEPALPGVLVVGTSLQQGEDPGLNEDAMEGASAAEFGLDHEEGKGEGLMGLRRGRWEGEGMMWEEGKGQWGRGGRKGRGNGIEMRRGGRKGRGRWLWLVVRIIIG